MKKSVLTAVLGIAVLLPAMAADFGLTIDANPVLSYDTGDTFVWKDCFTYTVKASLWGNCTIGENLTAEFQGGYTLEDDRLFLLEMDQLQLNGNFDVAGGSAGILSFKAGRHAFSDFSGKVFSHIGDGISLEWGLSSVSVSLFGAYTGFIQAPASTIIMNSTDLAAQDFERDTMWGPMGSPRAVEGVTFVFPELFVHQTVILSGVFQQDLRADKNFVAGDDRINTIYAGLGIMGPISVVPSLYYSLYGYGNTGRYGDNTIWAFLAGGGINYFMPNFFSSRIAFEGMYSSGDADQSSFYEGNTNGNALAFTPITPSEAGIVFTAQQTNLFYISGSYSMKPFAESDILSLRNILLLVKATGFFRSTPGAISTGGTNADATDLYLGTEFDLSIMSRLLSDVGLSLNGGVFLPSAVMKSQTPQMEISTVLSLSI